MLMDVKTIWFSRIYYFVLSCLFSDLTQVSISFRNIELCSAAVALAFTHKKCLTCLVNLNPINILINDSGDQVKINEICDFDIVSRLFLIPEIKLRIACTTVYVVDVENTRARANLFQKYYLRNSKWLPSLQK